MFSITLVNIDSYQVSPIPELDVTFSEFRGSEIKKVPVIRIFGSTSTGKKTCLHVHGVFPYMYVPCTVQENTDSFAYQLAASIDSALNTSFGSTLSTNQHVYKIQRVSGIPFYGYHKKKHLFFKIYFYNPAIIKRTADLLQNGVVLNQHFQSYETHIPYILQFMIDYNLYGMNLINLSNIRYRCSTEDSQNKDLADSLDSQMYLPAYIARQSMCELEVDTHASNILNRQNINDKIELNPGLAAIWEEEKARRAAVGLENVKSQLLYPKTPNKIILPPTSNDIYQEGLLLKKLSAISQSNETVLSDTNVFSYPVEVGNDERVLNTSLVLSHSESFISEENIERKTSNDNQLLRSNSELETNQSQNPITDSFLDADDIKLMEMLADLAEENDATSNVDNDSVLGSQYSILSNPAQNDPEKEEEEEVEDLNITSLDLDSVSSWDFAHKRSNQHGDTVMAEHDENNRVSSDDVDVTEGNCADVTFINLPQLDGVDDLCINVLEHKKKIVNCPTNVACCTAILPKDMKRNSCEKFTIPNIDGAIASDSSDSEFEVDVTIDRQEKRICVYKSSEKDTAQITPKKKRLSNDDNSESPNKRRNTSARTPKRKFYNSPSKMCRSPSRNYAPLDITITSPKTSKSPIGHRESPKEKQYVPISDIPSTSTTLKQNVGIDNVCEESEINKTNTVQNINDVNIKTSETTQRSKQHHEQKARSNEDSLIKGSIAVRKKLHFSHYDEVENIFTAPEHRANQFESSIAFGHLIDKVHADATTFSSSNDEDNVPSSQYTEVSDDTSPERNHASNIRNVKSTLRKLHDDVIPETDLDEDEEEDVCNTTFTQRVSQKMKSQTLLSQRSVRSSRDALITITTKYKPPDPEKIEESMALYGIPKCRMEKPFFSNKLDLAKHKKSSSANAPSFDVPAFKSSLQDITSIKLWRRMKVNEFYPSGSNIKTCHLKRTLAGYNLLTIKPLVTPPSSKDVRNWVRAKEYLSKKEHDAKSCKLVKGRMSLSAQDVPDPPIDVNKNDESLPGTSNQLISTTSSIERSVSLLSETSDDDRKFEHTQNSDDCQNSGDTLNPSLRKALENPLLYKQNERVQHFSYGQIEYSSKGSYGNVSNENLQNVRAVAAHQYLTLMSLEVHVITREDLLPDPQYDSIAALFYAIHNDIPTDAGEQTEHAAIIVNPYPVSARLNKMYSASTMCPILYVATERDVFNNLMKLIEQHNPDVLLGWEVESFSWGYVFQRAAHLALSGFPLRISKVPYVQISSNKSDAHTFEKDDMSEIKVPGRNILDVWRIMRHEAALLTYTFENVMYHVLHERVPCPSFKTLSTWWKHESIIIKCRVIHHYVIRIRGTLKILSQLDIIGRTCEYARLLGIQFYEVFSRGSQFRVESMMLRLAKPMNYIPISPSIHQKARMRAPECLPLIMEPESKFYIDPLIVLDFQSLYPSMIIAYNYCFSTCLGRIEHIGQPGPFDFGAATLKMKKSMVLKLQGKLNFSPCGVAFVKKEVRQGILPRMLMGILNTRLMVKESMKLHPEENRTLQRVLHSQQLGLKLIANVTYGYTSANFSGRMPCIEIADSVVSKGRETLERAIKLVESTSKWGGRVIYGDTDSMFVLLPGKSREEAFVIGEEIADAVTAANPPPVKLKFEKVLHPAILQTKKRYCGYMYETCNQEKPEFLAKGIETVRRDGCPAVAKILEKSLKILFDTKDISLVKSHIIRQFDKILRRRVSIQDLTFAKEFRGMRGYKANACVPALELTRRLIRKDPRAVPRTSERVRYVIIAGAPNQTLIQCVRTPMEVLTDPALMPNSVYYVTKVIAPPLNRCFNLFGIDVNTWYKEMCHRQSFDNIAYLGRDNPKSTIRQFFHSVACVTCGELTNKEVCTECVSQPSRTIVVLLEKICKLERTHQQIANICHSCIGRLGDIECASLDCPVLYQMVQARKELAQVPYLNNIIKEMT
ncbi:DNA polymerase zeta catalytic subunit isoform X2 [Odontomachus brunneus]|uniref:DNA polymerase zeta catalytic subunit isoform X2 n=1 Tax=Odontomachus brunneus TaxID=486640 RepID=UPI0013F26A65|nr:DNA polymerase zeta catalytic subunit isoform X2 [Odontomachus brunneus]